MKTPDWAATENTASDSRTLVDKRLPNETMPETVHFRPLTALFPVYIFSFVKLIENTACYKTRNTDEFLDTVGP
ncbi:hypothetical protein [Pseudomonas sp. KK4]|uniref:hypothetical protein n=1 Tax=Pseudomonas sp. KK4 TaxID=1855729 RepID=UPI001115A990|nr:hypothetical protein [Pseudomonas sp. KK4]